MEDFESPSVLEGVVDHIIFYNEDNGYAIFVLSHESEHGEDIITCTGIVPDVYEGEELKVSGVYVNNVKYGMQFSISETIKNIPSTAAGIEKYLASGVVKGIGAGLAKRIVAAFGDLTFSVIEETPEKLAEIKGITRKKAASIAESFYSQGEQRRAILMLQDYGISPVFAMKIYKKYKGNAIGILKKNPYRLAEDIDGIGFKIADNIAQKAGVLYDDPFRVAAGISYTLREAANGGHVFLPENILIPKAAELLGVGAEPISHALLNMQMDGNIYSEKSKNELWKAKIFLIHFYQIEKEVAGKLRILADSAAGSMKLDASHISLYQEKSGITLSDSQHDAVSEAVSSGVMIITGGPGTGKTTIINIIIRLLTSQGLKIELAAPTGRAAKRMTEASGCEAKTLHRLLETSFMAESAGRQTFQRNRDNPLETDVLIIDEVSMVDISLMHSVLCALAEGTRLIMVGDADQLPSVGPGNVLKDLIASECIKVIRLTDVFRQAGESEIIMNAHRINKGEYPILNKKNKDFFFIREAEAEAVVQKLLDLIKKRLPAYTGDSSFNDIQVLTPMRKSGLGMLRLNQVLQYNLNPPSHTKKEREYRQTVFREGDKVMQIKNNYQISWKLLDSNNLQIDEGEGIFNGDCGIITEINDRKELITVLFDDSKQVEYDFSQLEELELAYAITVHKSQGSEYKTVIMPIHSGPPLLFSRNLLYTAVTRAKSLCVIVGIPETLYSMVDNNREVNRYTALAQRIKSAFEL